MNRRFVSFLLCVAFLLPLTGCSALLDRDYRVETTHSEQSAGGNASILRADSYESMVSAIRQLVSDGTEHGVIRLYNYTGNVGRDLASACLEVKQQDPLGAYAVDYMTHTFTRIVSYYELDITIQYRRTPEQIRSIVSATDSSAVKEVLQNALKQFSPSATLRLSYFKENESYLRSLLEDAYYAVPQAAFGLPQCDITLYPDSGAERIVEITLTYSGDRQTLLDRKDQLETAAKNLKSGITADRSRKEAAAALYERLARQAAYAEEQAGKDTAYDAVINRKAGSCGIALSYKLLCDDAGIGCVVVRGTRNGRPWYWNIVNLDGVYGHVDLAAGILSGKPRFSPVSDQAMSGAYSWDRQNYPACKASA